jgi:hypothetical protein
MLIALITPITAKTVNMVDQDPRSTSPLPTKLPNDLRSTSAKNIIINIDII